MKMPKGKMMDNPRGMYSYKGNPMAPAKEVKPRCGPGGNPDQVKANKMMQAQQKKNEYTRGMSGM